MEMQPKDAAYKTAEESSAQSLGSWGPFSLLYARLIGWAPLRSMRIGEYILPPLLIIVSPQLLGGATSAGTMLITLVTAVALGLILLKYRVAASRAQSLIATLLALGIIWSLIQILPLPCSLVKHVASRSYIEVVRTASVLNRQANLCTLSLAPGATSTALMRSGIFCGTVVIAWILARCGVHREILKWVALSTVLMALITVVHGALGLSRVYGIYVPVDAAPKVVGPLLNDNHLAGFLSMGFFSIIFCVLRSDSRSFRVAWASAAVLVLSLIAFTQSPGGFVGLILGLMVFTFMYVGIRKNWVLPPFSKAIWVLGIFSVALVLNIVVIQEDSFSNFSLTSSWKKIDLIRLSFQTIFEQPLVGMGRGAFGSAFTKYAGDEVRYEYAENIISHLMNEWGVVVGGFIIIGLAVGFVRYAWAGGSKSLSVNAAIAGLNAIVFHDMVDFATELSGVSVIAGALIGVVLGVHKNTQPSSSKPKPPSTGSISAKQLGTLVLIASVLGLVGLPPFAQSRDRVAIERQLHKTERANQDEAYRKMLTQALRLYPSEPVFSTIAAYDALRREDPRAITWLNRTMQLAPLWPAPHIEAARWMFNHGHHEQGLMEVRAAAGLKSTRETYELFCAVLKQQPNVQWVYKAAPARQDARVDFLNHAADCPGIPAALVAEVDKNLIATFPNTIEPWIRSTRRAVIAKDNEGALRITRQARQRFPTNPEILSAAVSTLLAVNKPSTALSELQRSAALLTDKPDLLSLRAQAHTALGKAEEMRKDIIKIKSLANSEPLKLSVASTLQGDLELKLGHPGGALKAYMEAQRLAPERKDIGARLDAVYRILRKTP